MMKLKLAAGAVSLPEWNIDNLLITFVNWLTFISLAVIAPAYYLWWFWQRLHKSRPMFGAWLKGLSSKNTREDSELLSNHSLRAKLRTTLVSSSAQILTGLRLAVVGAIAWRWIRMHNDSQWLCKEWDPHISYIIGMVTIAYLVLIDIFRRRAELEQQRLTALAAESPMTGPGGIWSRNAVDKFFAPALCDVVYIAAMGVCLASPYNDMHLGLIVAVLSAWLFKNATRIFILWLSIVACILVQWYASMWLETGLTWSELSNSIKYNSAGSASNQDAYAASLSTVAAPRVVFWLIACLLMVVMRSVRRETEDNASFFRGLAEAMPFEVFVKNKRREFVYANQKLLKKLKGVSGLSGLNIQLIQGKTDAQLGISGEKLKHYEKIDKQILEGMPYYEEMEPSYSNEENGEILTIKAPVFAGDDRGSGLPRPAYIMGLCRASQEDSTPFFYLDIVAFERPHCFFSKRNGVFAWVNEQFAKDAGKYCASEIVGKTDLELYTRECASSYMQDDISVMKEEFLVKDEWHQPKDAPRRRVHVLKKLIRGEDGKPNGVRGYFKDVHAYYIRRAAIDLIAYSYLPKVMAIYKSRKSIESMPLDRVPKAHALLLWCLRLLNLGDYELLRLSGGDTSELTVHNKDLGVAFQEDKSPRRYLDLVCQLLHVLYPKHKVVSEFIIHDDCPQINKTWFQAAVFGLGLHSLLRCEIAGRHDEVINLSGYYGNHELVVFAADKITELRHPSEEFNSLKEYAHPNYPWCACGLQILDRIRQICGASVSVSLPNYPDEEYATKVTFHKNSLIFNTNHFARRGT